MKQNGKPAFSPRQRCQPIKVVIDTFGATGIFFSPIKFFKLFFHDFYYMFWNFLQNKFTVNPFPKLVCRK